MRGKIFSEKTDYTHLNWSKIRNSSGTAGSFLKAYSVEKGQKYYYKLSNYDSYKGIIGYECIHEIIADRLLDIWGFEHVTYDLLYGSVEIDGKKTDTYFCRSEDFKHPGESKIAFDIFYQMEKLFGESPLDFCTRMKWEDYIYKMLVLDFVILNRDRHGANIEVLRNGHDKIYRLAPLFDHGVSLLGAIGDDKEVSAFDIMEDKPVQCFVGSRSARQNLDLIPKGREPRICGYDEKYREFLLQGLEKIVSETYLEKVWEMIRERWCYYEDFCNQR